MENYESYLYTDNDFSSKLEGFHVTKVRKVPKARIIGAPIETGQVAFDNKVIDPYELIVTGTIVIDGKHESVLTQIEKMHQNRDFEFYSVRDGTTGYDNLSLIQAPRTRDVNQFDWIELELVFSHVMLVQKDSLLSKSTNSENSNFRNTGYSAGRSVK